MALARALAKARSLAKAGGLAKAQSLAALAGIILLAILIGPTAADGSRIFLQIGNLTDILRQISLIGIMALAMTYVILTGGIDLSVGSILALSTSLVAMGLTRAGQTASYAWHIVLAMAAAVAASALVGTLNGVVIAATRMQPFIVTLAAMIGVRGLAKWLTDNQNIDIGFGRDVAAEFAAVFRQKAIVIGAYAAGAAVFWVVLARTVFGRHVRAIGDNEKAAEYAGLPIRRTKVWVYTLSGLLSGLAGVLYAAENHQGNPNAGVAYELDAIAAVVIGGTRLSGGKGGISGTIVGTLTIGVLTNMLRLNNVDSNVEMMIKAAIIVLAVAVQRDR
ncbi:MAG TPA: ABC transporter permease [Candidatus Acidoferrales bacterium]|jgi:ribose transport system permease protein|nr:ABC transporter permease [Candidatus Acidoferrales bacterium]